MSATDLDRLNELLTMAEEVFSAANRDFGCSAEVPLNDVSQLRFTRVGSEWGLYARTGDVHVRLVSASLARRRVAAFKLDELWNAFQKVRAEAAEDNVKAIAAVESWLEAHIPPGEKE